MHTSKKTPDTMKRARDTIPQLPIGFTTERPGIPMFTTEFLELVAVLHFFYNFMVARPYEEKDFISISRDDVDYYTMAPSLIIKCQNSGELMEEYWKSVAEATGPGDRNLYLMRKILAMSRISEEYRMLLLLEEFYRDRDTPLRNRLIIEDNEKADFYLHPQSAATQAVLPEYTQRKQAQEVREEMLAFGRFLMQRYESGDTSLTKPIPKNHDGTLMLE